MKRLNIYFVFLLFPLFITCSSSTDTSTSLSIITVQIGFPENVDNIDIDNQIKIKLLQDDFVVKTKYLLWYENEYKLRLDVEPGEDYQVMAFAYKYDNIKYKTESEIFHITAGERKNLELILEYSDINEIIPPTGNLSNTKIAFISTVGLHTQIFKMNLDGSDRQQLTFFEQHSRDPAWSPDGQNIAFKSNINGNWEIHVMSSDGTGTTRLTYSYNCDEVPQWSPDGSKLFFQSQLDSYNFSSVQSINTDGSSQTIIFSSSTYGYGYYTPAISPDGQNIALSVIIDGNFGIYTSNIDGSDLARITFDNVQAGFPRWSPDGTKIVYSSTRDGNFEIYLMNNDGTGLTRLTNNTASDRRPCWSPDGSKIAFESDRDGHWEIYIMNIDGTDQTNITNSPANENRPSWSPYLN